jgi:hypothetical protein
VRSQPSNDAAAGREAYPLHGTLTVPLPKGKTMTTSHLDLPAAGETFTIGITITTSDDDTLDLMIETLEAFAKGDLRDILATADPLAKVMVDTNEGTVIWC